MAGSRPKLGVSSCLLGEQVRYDGGHKHNRYVTGMLGEWFDLVPRCPEVAIGLSIPRPPIRLVRHENEIRAVGVEDASRDFTEPLKHYAREAVGDLDDLSGYIVKKDSPSCGMERVKIYPAGLAEKKMPEKQGTGVYTGVIMKALPTLPVEEEGRLSDPALRENFIDRVFTRYRWQQMMAEGLTPASLVAFHTRHKFFVLAHNERVYRELGRLVARAGEGDPGQLADEYFELLMDGLKTHATPGKHANVLIHIMGFFKEHLDADDKAELLDVIESYRTGMVPLIVPITLVNHFLRKFPQPWVKGQVYLQPHPAELMLRNHV